MDHEKQTLPRERRPGGLNIRSSLFALLLLVVASLTAILLIKVSLERKMTDQYTAAMATSASLYRLEALTNGLFLEAENALLGRESRFAAETRELAMLTNWARDALPQSENSRFYLRTFSNMLEQFDKTVTKGRLSANAYTVLYDPVFGLEAQAAYLRKQVGQLLSASLANAEEAHTDALAVMRTATHTLNFITFAVILLVAAAAFALGHLMLRDLHRVSRMAQAMSRREWDVEGAPHSRFREVEHIVGAMHAMRRSIVEHLSAIREKNEIENRFIEEKMRGLRKDQIIRETQLRALQMQINPHFLFNTLNMISCTAMLKDTDTTVKLVEDISGIMRYSMQDNLFMQSLSTELSALAAYIRIQTVRFDGVISFGLTVSPKVDAQEVFLPPLTLQPLVENAVKHGHAQTTENGRVDITVDLAEEGVVITVSDNGIGVCEGELARIAEGAPGTGIGLRNVQERLRLSYGRTDLLTFESGGGLSVRLLLPKDVTPMASEGNG